MQQISSKAAQLSTKLPYLWSRCASKITFQDGNDSQDGTVNLSQDDTRCK